MNYLLIAVVMLVPNGSEKLVTNKNRKQFVQLYAETAYLNRCTDSIAAMRKGLLKVKSAPADTLKSWS